MSTEMITAPVAQDVTEDLHLIARTPSEMQQAQSSLSQWFTAKIAMCEKEVDDLDANLKIALANKWKIATFERALNRAVSRQRFYEKCKAAVDGGFCIVPNFPVDVFAIRTTRERPRRNESRWSGEAGRIQTSESPAVGLGEYRDSAPTTKSRTEHVYDDKTGLTNPVRMHYAANWDEEIEFPVSVARPTIMSATAEAMALKCFDELGVLPATSRSKGDPIVVGIIRDQLSAKQLSFMIAWYIDTSML